MRAAPSPLNDIELERLVGATALQRGLPYWRRGAILQPQRQDHTLRGQCEGSRPTPYEIVIELPPHGPHSARCSCPVGAQGRCKHVAALATLWHHEPERFTPIPSLAEALRARSREELEAMIQHIIACEPEQALLLGMRFPTDTPRSGPLDPAPYHAAIAHRLHVSALATPSQRDAALRPYLHLAAQLTARADGVAAVITLDALLRALISPAPPPHNPLEQLALDALDALGATLHELELPPTSQHLAMDLLIDLAHQPQADGELARHARDLALTLTSPAQRQRLALTLRQRLGLSHADETQRDSWLLLQLEAHQLDDATYLSRCRALGKTEAIIRHLLARSRAQEAILEAREASDELFAQLILEFSARGHTEQIVDEVQQRYARTAHTPLLAWLEERHAARGEWAAALTAAQTRFWRAPLASLYERLRDYASHDPSGYAWALLRPGLLAHLRERGDWLTLASCALLEDALDEALRIAEEPRHRAQGAREAWLALDELLLERASATRPHSALRAAQRAAEARLERPGQLELALDHLARAHALTRTIAEPSLWRDYRGQLETRFSRVSGLSEGLTQRGLDA